MAQPPRNNNRSDDQDTNALVVQAPRLPMPPEAEEKGYTEGKWRALIDAIYPTARSVGAVMLAIDYCQSRNLDIFKKPVHIVPIWNSSLSREVEGIWPGIGEYRSTASRTRLHAGNDDCQFGQTLNRAFSGKRTRKARKQGENDTVTEASCDAFDWPEWAQITVYKMVQGHRVAFVGPKVRFTEIFSGQKGLRVPNERWQQAPWQMLEKCAEAAALRRAFPDELGDTWTAEEMEGKDVDAIAGEFRVVDPGPQPEEEKKPAAPKRTDTPDPEEEKLKWWREPRETAIGEFMEVVEAGLPKAKSVRAVDKWLTDAKDEIEHLPVAEHTRLMAMIDQRRREISSPKDRGKIQSESNTSSSTQTESPQPIDESANFVDKDEPSDTERFDKYLEQLRGFFRSAKTPIDVNSLNSRETQSIAQLSPEHALRAVTMYNIAMKVAKEGGNFDALLDEKLFQLDAATAGSSAQETPSEDKQ